MKWALVVFSTLAGKQKLMSKELQLNGCISSFSGQFRGIVLWFYDCVMYLLPSSMEQTWIWPNSSPRLGFWILWSLQSELHQPLDFGWFYHLNFLGIACLSLERSLSLEGVCVRSTSFWICIALLNSRCQAGQINFFFLPFFFLFKNFICFSLVDSELVSDNCLSMVVAAQMLDAATNPLVFPLPSPFHPLNGLVRIWNIFPSFSEVW